MDAATYIATVSSHAQFEPASAPSARRRAFRTPLPRWARIFIFIVMLVTSLAALISHDLLLRWNAETRLRVEATGMAIAGASFLPGAPERALEAAAHCGKRFGLVPADIVDSAPAQDRMSFRVTLSQTLPVLFFRILGSETVTVEATATVHPYASPSQADRAMVLSMRRPTSHARRCPTLAFVA